MNTINPNFFQTGVHNQVQPSQDVTASEAQSSFANELKNAINEVNQTQADSSMKTEELIRGEATDLHDVMITSQKASVTLQTASEIQNKAIEAYREVMRMQI
ncbi:flagellar hook-basal body complex protein FliE [Halalkalibacillus halophilus]|uniref:flagellar hook-basal body complex protein FliE n=1 Tax=Halalkalibacillus halophilus TaxID=392827 RepID=UPI0004015E4E|nr:flagellar hook-basal body complex protein FliE [Halalkalibacillus halophilus]